MSQFTVNYDAILFPSDGRPPSIVQLMTSPMDSNASPPSRMPHPEVYMDYIAEGYGSRAWRYQLIEALDGMNRTFALPYIIFYPTVSRDNMPFPINRTIREIQGGSFRAEHAWRGNIIVARYTGNMPFSCMVDAAMSDFPLVKNYFITHGAPPQA
ncbi:hypothetical protein JR316_0004553 [Psilocybe cubensis]|uniref:Uncharacterized protein n=2 Tax=Psilocybe cubensis TaxID=181762 RepID=A0ACB8H3H9_PSICU|nr:hypothetical protein JR316_0004553 [Psilocybe cubensis]KAH9482453.1 hypothetical protein JR316_0004553 [Psilocybe cubensis]